MHYEANEYLKHARLLITTCDSVLELGSYNVNGSAREHFPDCRYVGLDQRPGRGVDVVGDAESFDGDESFDVVVSTETLEHTPSPEKVIRSAWRSLRPGGVLILTAAAPERRPHNSNGDHWFDDDEHYAGVGKSDLRRWLSDWSILELEHHPSRGDIYAIAIKPIRSQHACQHSE